jgi:pimeloyl-ACP methyl ester carboxylesterase
MSYAYIMKTVRRALRWALVVFVVLLAITAGLSRLVDFRQDDANLLAEFAGQTTQPTVHRYRVAVPGEAPRTIRFLEMPALPDTIERGPAQPVIVFVHGAPSSLSFFADFFKDTTLTNRARLVAVDRPGYGYSDFGRVETSVARQARWLQPLIERYRNAPYLLLVGSSYGGSVSARLAMNNPGLVDHVLFVSSSLGPGLERTYPISYLIDHPAVRWLIPTLLQLANDEKLAHRRALEEILPDWPRITARITILHGQMDDLIFPTNVSFARNRLVNTQVQQYLLPESHHDIVMNRRDYMTNVIRQILSRREGKPAVLSRQMAMDAHPVAPASAVN